MPSIRVLLVDDHEAVRNGIRALLTTYPSITICGEAINGSDAIEKAVASRPSVVLMDITMPGMNGMDATREIKRLLPETEIIIVSQHEAPEVIRQAVSAGAKGYVMKSRLAAELLSAIHKVSQHESVFEGIGDYPNQNACDPKPPQPSHRRVTRNADRS